MSKTHMKDIPYFKKLLLKSVYKFHQKDSNTAKNINKMYNDYYVNNEKLKTFLSDFLKQYSIACLIFHDFQSVLRQKLKLNSMYVKYL